MIPPMTGRIGLGLAPMDTDIVSAVRDSSLREAIKYNIFNFYCSPPHYG